MLQIENNILYFKTFHLFVRVFIIIKLKYVRIFSISYQNVLEIKEELRFILFSVSSLFKSMLNNKIIFILSCLVIYSSAAQINGFVIVDTRSNKEVMEIVDKMAIDLKQNPAIGIIAKTDDDTKTVKFSLDGISPYRIETAAPFSLQGDNNGQIFPVNLVPGSHKLSAIPTSNSTSLDGKEVVINFEIVDSIGKGLLRIGYLTYELVNAEDEKVWKQLSNADFTSAPERVYTLLLFYSIIL